MAMIKFFSLLIILQISNCSSVSNEDDIYSVAKGFIVSSESAKGYAQEVFGTTQVNPYVSSELIPFNFSSVGIDVIKRNYIKGYNAFSELSEKERSIEKYVIDSPNTLDKTFQSESKQNENSSLSLLSEGDQNNFIIFFSERKDGVLYAELIPYDSSTFKDKKKETVQYGKALTYLFEFDSRGEIKQVFQGETHYN